jgi:tetratricopeptide (TPR) repeat protein
MQDYLARVGRLEALLKNGRGRAVPAPARSPARVTGVLLLVLLLGASGPVAGQERPPAAPAAPPAKALVRDLGDPEPRVRAGAEAALLAAGRAAVPLLLAEIAPHVAEPESARLETLIEQLDSPDYATREAATRALIEMGGDAVPALERVAKEGSPEASHRARYALGEIAKQKEAAGPRDDPRLRGREAMYLLGRLGEAGDVEAIVAATLSEDGYPDEGLRALAGIERRARNSLQPLLSRPDRSVRLLAIRALALAGVEPARPLLLPLAFDPDSGIRTAVRRALLTPELVETIDRARMQLEQKEFEKAEAELTRVLRLCPGEPHAGRLLALRRLASGRAKEGLEIAEGLSLPEAEREMLCARMLAATGDREAARARLMDAARAAPADPEPLIRAAELDGKANPPRIGAAVQALEEAAKRAPVDARVWARLGAVYGEGARDRTNAVRCYRRALDLDPGNGDYLKALVRYR